MEIVPDSRIPGSTVPTIETTETIQTMKRSGFTLVELLLVIAVIGILSGLLFTGVLGLVGQARDAANEDNATMLEAAIMEYWHDQGRWPLPAGHKPKKSQTGKTAGDIAREREIGADAISEEMEHSKIYTYKLVYGEVGSNGAVKNNGYGQEHSNNSEIVKILLDAKVGKKKSEKKYLELDSFITVEDGVDGNAPDGGYPIEEVRSARGLDADAKAGKVPLLFRAKFIKCNHCNKLYSKTGDRRKCTNDDCPYKKSQGSAYRFTAGELKGNAEGAKPYVITFDFINNKCDVTMP